MGSGCGKTIDVAMIMERKEIKDVLKGIRVLSRSLGCTRLRRREIGKRVCVIFFMNFLFICAIHVLIVKMIT